MSNNAEGGDLYLWEKPLDALGLMRGPYSPFYRAGFGFALASILLWAFRPSFAFSEDGQPLPWTRSSKGRGSSYPWWMIAVGTGIVFGVFI